jgi:hypothetical protein
MFFRFPWLAPSIVAAVAAGILARPGTAADAQKPRDYVATCSKIDGALLEKTATGFRNMQVGDKISPKTLLIGFPDALLASGDGKVQIHLMLNKRNKLPVTEAAISLNDDPALSADINLDRGVIGVKAMGNEANVHVKVRAGQEVWSLTLKEPGTKVVVARFGRHTPGVREHQDAAKKILSDVPQMHFGVLVVTGAAVVDTGSIRYAMKAPPGPALLAWDSVGGLENKYMEKLPDELAPRSPEDEKIHAAVCAVCARLAAGKDLGKGLEGMEQSKEMVERLVAVAAMGAVDDLPRLWHVLEDSKNADAREQAIRTLRNWIGRKPGQIKLLYDHLTMNAKLQNNKAKNAILLLRGFDDRDTGEPALYQLLLNEMEVGLLPLRELAYWHMLRLAPVIETITYDAAMDDAARQKAVAQMRQMIPAGQLPPPPAAQKTKKAG